MHGAGAGNGWAKCIFKLCHLTDDGIHLLDAADSHGFLGRLFDDCAWPALGTIFPDLIGRSDTESCQEKRCQNDGDCQDDPVHVRSLET